MPLPLQSKLLRVLEGKVQRVGSNKEIDVDFNSFVQPIKI